ncbi:hypothetical protein ACFBZI_11360 [Moraxella sp. ZJ142]|uniref:hypothetical protein n=1 Tax=Moraxella marmotae TaxID=3344520 RepID=UPI0035D499F0
MAIQRKSTQTTPVAQTTTPTQNAQQATLGNGQTQNTTANNKVTPVTNSSKDRLDGLKVLLLPVLMAACFGGGFYAGANGYHGPTTLKNRAAVEEKVATFGQIKDSETKDGFTAFQLGTENGDTVLYSTNDGKHFILGEVYKNTEDTPSLFAEFLEKISSQAPQAQPAESQAAPGVSYENVGTVVGEFSGEVPSIMSVLEEMGGYKENASVAPENTVYVFYDPRCPYCHSLFDKSRELDQANVTIKWLPTIALGNDGGDQSDALRLAAAGLNIKDAQELRALFDRTSQGVDHVSDEMRSKLDENLSSLYFAADQMYGEGSRRGVPAAIFLDKKSGKVQLVYGLSNDNIYNAVFGLNK